MRLNGQLYCRLGIRVFVILAVGGAAILLAGCSYTVSMNPNIAPTASIANQIDLKVGLFIPEGVKGLTVTDSPTPVYKYTFRVGKSIESLITKATDRVFSSVDVLESYPTSQMIYDRQLALVITAKVTSAMLNLTHKQGFFSHEAGGNASFSVQLTFYTPEMLQLTSVVASGMGIGSESWGLSSGQKEFSASVESAIRNLGDDLVQQMYGNYDIRKMAETQ